MDDLDRDILGTLRHNARIPASSLAAMTGASRATIAARIDRVERRLSYAGNDVGAPAPAGSSQPVAGAAAAGAAAGSGAALGSGSGSALASAWCGGKPSFAR